MDKTFRRYIKDVSTALAYKCCDIRHFPNLSKEKDKIRKFALKAIKNYVSFRLKLMTNENITNVEKELITAAVKAGVKYSAKEFGFSYDYIDKAVEYILPDVLAYIQTKRVKLFTDILENENLII